MYEPTIVSELQSILDGVLAKAEGLGRKVQSLSPNSQRGIILKQRYERIVQTLYFAENSRIVPLIQEAETLPLSDSQKRKLRKKKARHEQMMERIKNLVRQ